MFNFDPNAKPVTETNNGWQKTADGNYRQKLKADCNVFDCDVEVLEATTTLKYQPSDKNTYEYLILNLGLIKGGQLSDTYLQLKIKGSKVVNGVSNVTNRIFNILGIATTQRKDATKTLGDVVKYDYNKNQSTHTLLNMQGLRYHAIIATTGEYNGYCTYSCYLYSPEKQSFEEIQAHDNSLKAFNKGLEQMQLKRNEFVQSGANGFSGAQQGYGEGVQQGFIATARQNNNNYYTGVQPQLDTKTANNLNKMESLNGVISNPDNNQALDDDLPF